MGQSPVYRADVDGLRALAVLAVVGFHAFPKSVRGGFVGVDVFFVISGFLISSLILSDLKQGSFSFLQFYARRIRRLFPALILVLLTVLVLGYITMLPGDFAALGKHTLAAAGFAGNILNYSEAGYFDAPADKKALLHLWSLGVEEQFYFMFPAILIGIWRLKSARAFLATLGVASFALNVVLVQDYPSFTFYIPLTRFWEFIAGAMLAWSLSTIPPSWLVADENQRMRDAASVAGILLVLGAILLAHKAGFPGWTAILPVAGTVLAIWAGPNAWLNRNFLSRPWLVFIGLISYPLYLWHWPLLVFAKHELDLAPGTALRHFRSEAVIALSFLLAWATYRFIETPVRAWRPSKARWQIPVALAAGIVASACFGGFVVARSGLPTRYPPELAPLLMPLTPLDYPTEGANLNVSGPTVVVFGDSHAAHLIPGLQRVQLTRPFILHRMDWWFCPPWGDVPSIGNVALSKALAKLHCKERIANNEQALKEMPPDIVVLAGYWLEYEHPERISETIKFLKQIGVRRVVVVGGVPSWPEPPQLLIRRAYLSRPGTVPDRLPDFDKRTLEIDHRLKELADDLGAVFISSYGVLCNNTDCLVRLGNTARDIIQVDRHHLSAAGSWFLVSHIADKIFAGSDSEASAQSTTSTLQR